MFRFFIFKRVGHCLLYVATLAVLNRTTHAEEVRCEPHLLKSILNDGYEVPAASALKDLTGSTMSEAESALKNSGFVFKSLTAGGYHQWRHTDGSVIWIRPNGEIVRPGPKIRSSGGRMFAPRFNQRGERVTEHNTQEYLKTSESE